MTKHRALASMWTLAAASWPASMVSRWLALALLAIELSILVWFVVGGVLQADGRRAVHRPRRHRIQA